MQKLCTSSSLKMKGTNEITDLVERQKECQLSLKNSVATKLHESLFLSHAFWIFFPQREMRLFKILFLLAFGLVFAKTEDEWISDTTGDEAAVENLDDGTDFDAETASMEDAPKEEVPRQLLPTRPPIIRPVYVPMYVPGNMNSAFFKICYCFRRLCYGKY